MTKRVDKEACPRVANVCTLHSRFIPSSMESKALLRESILAIRFCCGIRSKWDRPFNAQMLCLNGNFRIFLMLATPSSLYSALTPPDGVFLIGKNKGLAGIPYWGLVI